MIHCWSDYLINLGGKDDVNQTSKNVTATHRINSNRQSVDETSVVPVSCVVSDVYTEQNEGTIHFKSNVAAKKGKIIF